MRARFRAGRLKILRAMPVDRSDTGARAGKVTLPVRPERAARGPARPPRYDPASGQEGTVR
jgi:hypothetical protein